MSSSSPRFSFGPSSLRASGALLALTRPNSKLQDQSSQPGAPGKLTASMFVGATQVSGTWQTVSQVQEHLREHTDTFAVITLDCPDNEQLMELGKAFDLHPVLLEDATQVHQRPRFDRDSSSAVAVFKSARYVDQTESVVFEEIHLIALPQCVTVIRLAPDSDLVGPNAQAPAWFCELTKPQASYLAVGTMGVLYAVLDALVDDYFPVITGISDDVDEIELQVFSGDPTAPERIYRLSREVVAFQRAVVPLRDVVGELIESFEQNSHAEHLGHYIKDVHNHLIRIAERITDARELLAQILTVNSTLVGQRQNEDMKRISSWAAILFAPTLIGAIYGMNFKNMPELEWFYGYPLALGAMVLFGIGLYVVFKSKKWL